MSLPLSAKVPFGGDYNPEQWPEDVWKQDYRLFDTARIDLVTLGLVDWALTQPAEEVTARTGGVDLLSGDRTAPGGALRLPAYGVVVLEEDR